MKSNRLILLLSGFLFLASCAKNKEQPKTATDLLTQKKWALVNYGTDINKNNVLDINERVNMDCQKENSYLFNTNGSGTIHLNATGCDEGIKETAFAWRLINDNTAIDLIFGISSIMTLDENEMILYDDANGQSGKMFFIYRHPS